MNTAEVREQMVQQQVRTWDVFDPAVLNLMRTLERDRFVPEAYRDVAYAETQIPLGHGQRMLTPMMEGRLLQTLALRADERVLEIGTGSGYLAACLASAAESVTSIDVYGDFVDAAAERLAHLDINNVTLETMDAFQSLPEGPFDAVMVTGSVPRVPESFLNVLRPGGRMIIVVGEAPVMQAQMLTRGEGSEWHTTSLFETVLPALINAESPPPFAF